MASKGQHRTTFKKVSGWLEYLLRGLLPTRLLLPSMTRQPFFIDLHWRPWSWPFERECDCVPLFIVDSEESSSWLHRFRLHRRRDVTVSGSTSWRQRFRLHRRRARLCLLLNVVTSPFRPLTCKVNTTYLQPHSDPGDQFVHQQLSRAKIQQRKPFCLLHRPIFFYVRRRRRSTTTRGKSKKKVLPSTISTTTTRGRGDHRSCSSV